MNNFQGGGTPGTLYNEQGRTLLYGEGTFLLGSVKMAGPRPEHESGATLHGYQQQILYYWIGFDSTSLLVSTGGALRSNH